MKGFPPELIYVLVFIGIFLLQHLMKRRGSQAPPEPAQHDGLPPTVYETTPDRAEPGQPAREWPSPPVSVEPFARPEPPAAVRARPRRRFARQSLMGTQRDVQNAVVIATIMGPCRALEPPDHAAPATSRPAAR